MSTRSRRPTTNCEFVVARGGSGSGTRIWTAIAARCDVAKYCARMLRAVVDTNAVDPIIDIPGALAALNQARKSGDLDLLFTHITVDELAVVPAEDRRVRLLLAVFEVGRLVATGASAADFSRVGFCRLGSDADDQYFEALRSASV